MAEKPAVVNSTSKPMPTSFASNIRHYTGDRKAMKGGSEIKNPMPEKGTVKGKTS